MGEIQNRSIFYESVSDTVAGPMSEHWDLPKIGLRTTWRSRPNEGKVPNITRIRWLFLCSMTEVCRWEPTSECMAALAHAGGDFRGSKIEWFWLEMMYFVDHKPVKVIW